MGTGMLGGLALAAFLSGDLTKAAIGFVPICMLACMYGWVWRQTRHPALQTDGRRVQVRGTLGRDYDIEDIGQYTLVLGSDWVGIRRKGDQDIMIDKNRFSRRDWEHVVTHLRTLPFEQII